MSLHLWLIPALPLIGASINGLFGKHFSNRLVSTIALGLTGASFAWAIFAAIQFLSLSPAEVPHMEHYGNWLQLCSGMNTFHVEFGAFLDGLSMVMMLIVTGVGFLIHIYSIGYMSQEPGYYRFFSYLNLFMFFMLTLVLANNYLLMFVGWEGVGLASYLLIGFYFLRDSAVAAGKKAFITNRVGDFGFLIALFLLVKHFNTLQYSELFAKIAIYPTEIGAGLLTAISVLMFAGATGKSAQIPLYVWLPDAMEGPTPVSALIHAATMVTAGVYIVCRSNVIFSRSPIALMVVAIIGALTAFFAATIGITQTDIKRVLAYSTVSQLGYMMMAAGVAAYSAAIFHLMTHAFFKALLFLGAGSVIHTIGGEQDMRKMGGLRKYMPWTFWSMIIATCAIAGIPGFAGFFSKDEILWQLYSSAGGSWILWLVGIVTAFMTSFYMFRLIFMTFCGEYYGDAGNHVEPTTAQVHHGAPHESPWVMLAPLVILAVLSTIGGYIGINHRFEHFLPPGMSSDIHLPMKMLAEPNTVEHIFMGISILTSFLGLGLAYLLYVWKRDLPNRIASSASFIYKTVLNKYYIDELYSKVLILPLVAVARDFLWKVVDQRVIDNAIKSCTLRTHDLSEESRKLYSGNIRSYAGWICVGAALIALYMLWMAPR